MRHLGEALGKVRKTECARLSGGDRRFIKGREYNLLSRNESLTPEGKRSLKILLAANRRLNTAYILKQAFCQLWDYEREAWARRFFDNWRASLKWQRLEPYERFADLIDRHRDGIAAYCKPENRVSLGFVEGMNNKIRRISPPQGSHLHAASSVAAAENPSHVIVLPVVPSRRPKPRHNTRLVTNIIAVDMMDNASALPTCPQRNYKRR